MPDEHHIRLNVTYDGTNYAGWQRQLNAPSVQQHLEEAVLKLTGQHTCVHGASRTDKSVHALCQVAHFVTHSIIPPEKYCLALNTCLPADIRVIGSMAAPVDFHARFSARSKVYRYCIHNHRYPSALYRNQRAHVFYPLDADLMDAEAQAILGRHDFRAFAASGSVTKDTERTMHRVMVRRHGDQVVLLVCGNAFLYNMVRILAGTLIGVGAGRAAPGTLQKGIATGDRLDLDVTAPAHGLTLMRVFYEDDLAEADTYFSPEMYL